MAVLTEVRHADFGLRCSIILFHHIHLVLLGSVFDISDQLHPLASLIIFLYVIFRHVLFFYHDQMIHYVLSVPLY